jgi:hypothetical protein
MPQFAYRTPNAQSGVRCHCRHLPPAEILGVFEQDKAGIEKAAAGRTKYFER